MRGGHRDKRIGWGMGKIVTVSNDTMVGEVYFEVHPDRLLGTTAEQHQQNIVVEIYGGIQAYRQSGCDEGILLGKRLVNMTGTDDKVENFAYTTFAFEVYNSMFQNDTIECHPRSSNGAMGAAIFTLNDPFYYNK